MNDPVNGTNPVTTKEAEPVEDDIVKVGEEVAYVLGPSMRNRNNCREFQAFVTEVHSPECVNLSVRFGPNEVETVTSVTDNPNDPSYFKRLTPEGVFEQAAPDAA